MKKIVLACVFVLLLSLFGCGANEEKKQNDQPLPPEYKEIEMITNMVLRFSFARPMPLEKMRQAVVKDPQDPVKKKWMVAEYANDKAPESPFLRIDINPETYDTSTADVVYILKEAPNGDLEIEETRVVSGPQNDDGLRILQAELLTSRNGFIYGFTFLYNDGGMSFDALFERVLRSFIFYK